MTLNRINILIVVALCCIFFRFDKAFATCIISWSGSDPDPTPETLTAYSCSSYQEGDTELFRECAKQS